MPLLFRFYLFPESVLRYFIRVISTPLSPVLEGFKEEIEAFKIKNNNNKEYNKEVFRKKRKRSKFNCKYFIDIPTLFKKEVEKGVK